MNSLHFGGNTLDFLDKIYAFCAEHHISVSRFEREDGIVLQPFNRHFDSVSYSLEEMDLLPLILVGRVVGMHRDISGKSSE